MTEKPFTVAPQDTVIDADFKAEPQSTLEAPTQATPSLKAATPQAIRRIGAMQVEDEKSELLDKFLDDQRNLYQGYGKDQLIEALLERDRVLALEGRQLADGRTAGRLLREFVRGILSRADHAQLRQVGDGTKTGNIEQILIALGAEPSDLRQLKLNGDMLGKTDEQQRMAAEKFGAHVPEAERSSK